MSNARELALENTGARLKVKNKELKEALAYYTVPENFRALKSLQSQASSLAEALEITADCFSDWVIGGGNKSATVVLADAYKLLANYRGEVK